MEKPRRGWRTITVDDVAYLWRVLLCGDVLIEAADRTQRRVTLTEAYGLTSAEVEHGLWEKWFRVTPRHVACIIRGKIPVDHSDPPLEATRRRIAESLGMDWGAFVAARDALIQAGR